MLSALKVFAGCVLLASIGLAQTPAHRKQLLAVGEEKGYRHEAVSHALATIERLGRETGLDEVALAFGFAPQTLRVW
jgi:uncharacterized protein